MILHDTLEDCEVSFSQIAEELTPLVASLVLELTNNKDEINKLGKKEYQKNKLLGMSSWAVTLKLIDFLYNISDSPGEKRSKDIVEIVEYLQSNRKLSDTQNRIIKDIVSIGTTSNV